MLLDISRALRAPGEEFPFVQGETLEPQDICGETVTFDPLTISGHYTLAGESVVLTGRLKTTAHARCANCLERADVPLDIPFREVFVQTPAALEQDDDRFAFEGSRIELSQMALSLAVLALPMRFLCREDCPGFLPAQDQSSHACQKDSQTQHPFSALQQLLTKDEEV